jgi:tetratricopeptide (TPR) repeat protein
MRASPASSRIALALLVSTLLGACGGAGPNGSTLPLRERAVSAETYGEVRRLYLVLGPDDPARAEVRDRLVNYLAQNGEALIAADDYDGIVARLAEMTSLLSPADLAPGGSVPSAIRPLARYVVDVGSRRGDESRVLAGLMLLLRIGGDDAAALQAEYDRLATWGHDARIGSADARPSFERLFDGAVGLLEVWQEHARLCPSPEVLERLSGTFVELSHAFSGGTVTEGFAPRLSPSSMEELSFVSALLERTPLEIAAVWLAQGDLDAARAHLQSMGDETGMEWRVRRVIETAMQPDQDGADALYEIATGYAEVRSDVAAAMCRLGVRAHPADPRFSLCLARLTGAMGEAGESTAWYREAVRLSPDDRAVYDEALTQLSHALESGAFGSDETVGIGQMRQIDQDAEAILSERTRRWPTEPAEVTLAAIRFSVGRAEMSAGNIEEARASLQASVTEQPTRAALEELATIAMRTGEPAQAVTLLEDALGRLSQQGRDGQLERASILEALGEAHRLAGQNDDAMRAYRQALDIYRPLADAGDETEQAILHVRLGSLVRRLGERPASDREYRLAMAAAPSWREPFAEILAHLVVDGPDHALAEEVFRAARVGSQLADEWKIYFALWVQLIASLGDQGTSFEAEQTLRERAGGSGWHAHLAQLATGAATYEHVLSAATSTGQRCEAHFYAGARALEQGDRAAARTAFEAAVATHMVSYFEYVMAQELLRSLGPDTRAPSVGRAD